jgi:hypothetical protein
MIDWQTTLMCVSNLVNNLRDITILIPTFTRPENTKLKDVFLVDRGPLPSPEASLDCPTLLLRHFRPGVCIVEAQLCAMVTNETYDRYYVHSFVS